MGRARPTNSAEPTQEPTPTEEAVLALVAAILAGSVSVPNPTLAIAEALLNLIPGFFSPDLSARISADVARLVVSDQTGLRNVSGATRVANLGYRAAYAVAAVKRLVKAVRGPSEESVDERLTKALRAEASYLQAHLNASKRREDAANLVDAAARVHGPLLGWYSVIDEKTTLDCRRANGKNFEVSNPPKIGYPGSVHPFCRCSPGAPFPDARTIS